MGINPGNPAFGLPPAEDDMARQLKDLERTTRENLASVVSSFKTTVDALNNAIAQLVTPVWTKNTITGFAVPPASSGGITVSASLTVPANVTKCSLIVIADAFVSGLDTGGGDATAYISITEPITSVAYSMTHIPEMSFSSVQTFAIGGINDVGSGDIMTFSALLRTNQTAGLPMNANNYLTVSAMATFQR